MASSRNFIFVLLWLSLLVSAGTYLFAKGFLLSRVSRTDVSSCVKYEDYDCGHGGSTEKRRCDGTDKVASILRDVNGTSGICFPSKAKVILLVIDALRYDFGLYDPENKEPAPYENKLPILTELLRKHPDHSRRLKFIADPPTTTMQRLKALTTGGLPTFIDMGSNFASPEINEDNLIDQLVQHNRTAVFLGDGTWTELFPKRFTREYAYQSFNIYDLDTVDTAIEKYLPREMARKDWDIIVAHFLGVDHCGHRYGPSHDEMRRKLEEMNEVIRNVTEQMTDGTTLIVIGDHGMTKTGDHGGETPDEVESLLFTYSKGTPLLSSDYADVDSETMQQIDLVPTLAAIMGIPIPYSNLGQINVQLLPDIPIDSFLRYQLVLVHMWQNAKQVQHFFQSYAESTGEFGVEMLDEFENRFLILTQRVNTVYTEAAFHTFSTDLRTHLKDILEGCREIWIQFDPQQMAHGLLITFMACFGMAILVVNSTPYQLGRIFNENALTGVFLFLCIVTPAGYFFYDDLELTSPEHGAILFAGMGSILMLCFLTIHHWPAISDNMADLKRTANVLTRISFVYTTCVFFSNSFIVQEQRILSYVLAGFFLAALYTLHELGGKFSLPRWKLALVRKSLMVKLIGLTIFALTLIRVSERYFRCREEQGNCTDFIVKAPAPTPEGQRKRSASDVEFLPIVALVIYVVCARLYMRASGNLAGTGPNVMLARYGPTVAVVCACGHFTVTNTGIQGIPQLHVDALAWVVYGLLVVQLIVLIVNPLLVFVLPRREDALKLLRTDSNMASEIYKQLKESYDRLVAGGAQSQGAAPDIPIVCGLATVYSSVFVATGAILTVVLAMLLGSHGTMGLMIVNSLAVVYAILSAIMQYEQTSSLFACVQPTFRTLLVWILLQHFGFFATSHQPTLSQIDWTAAFVGRTYHFDENNVLSGLLVILNTFSATFLLSVLFPLVVFLPFCVYARCPGLAEQSPPKQPLTTPKPAGGAGGSLSAARAETTPSVRTVATEGGSVEYRSVTVNKADESGEGQPPSAPSNKKVDFDVTKGELNLYEKEKLLIGTVFKSGCLLLLLQSIRVFCAMFACALHCRHLMVWKIFAPRFIYEGIGSYVMFVGINLGFLLLLRVNGAVSGLMTAINKSR